MNSAMQAHREKIVKILIPIIPTLLFVPASELKLFVLAIPRSLSGGVTTPERLCHELSVGRGGVRSIHRNPRGMDRARVLTNEVSIRIQEFLMIGPVVTIAIKADRN